MRRQEACKPLPKHIADHADSLEALLDRRGPSCKIEWSEQNPPALIYKVGTPSTLDFLGSLPKRLAQSGVRKPGSVDEFDPAVIALRQDLASIAQEKQAKT